MYFSTVNVKNSRVIIGTSRTVGQISSLKLKFFIFFLPFNFPLSPRQWLNLCMDMVSLVGETWSGQTYHAIDHITVSANCKVRRIFTMKSQSPDTTDDSGQFGVVFCFCFCFSKNQHFCSVLEVTVWSLPNHVELLHFLCLSCTGWVISPCGSKISAACWLSRVVSDNCWRNALL